jgi:anti-sigma regulatory factor (Ser/Thr protein kinase)
MMGYVFMRFGVDFRPENVDRLREKVGECLERGGIVGTTAFLLLNLMDELVCNILEHSGATWVELEMHPDAKEVRLILRDDGEAFDPGATMSDGRELEAVASGRSERSLGLYMAGRIAKTWEYHRKDKSVNELNLVVDL